MSPKKNASSNKSKRSKKSKAAEKSEELGRPVKPKVRKKRADVRPPIVVAGQIIEAGKRRRFELPVARLQTDAEATLPVCVLHGPKDGPTIWVDAAIHGDELNGVEIIRRLLVKLEVKNLAGTLIAVPIVNVFGFLSQSRYLPDRRDLNRSFPGSPRGSLAARIAHIFVTEIVEKCSVGIDLHTGSDGRTNVPQIRADLDDAMTRSCAESFAAPVILHSSIRDGSLRAVASSMGAKVLLYEAGESLRFHEGSISAGVTGVLRVMKQLGMIDEAPKASEPSFISRSSRWVRASRSGLFHATTALGAHVDAHQEIGFVTTPYDAKKSSVRSPFAGVIIGGANNPLVYKGDALVHVAEHQLV